MILREKEKPIFDDGVIVLFSAFEPLRLKFHLKSKQELLLLEGFGHDEPDGFS